MSEIQDLIPFDNFLGIDRDFQGRITRSLGAVEIRYFYYPEGHEMGGHF